MIKSEIAKELEREGKRRRKAEKNRMRKLLLATMQREDYEPAFYTTYQVAIYLTIQSERIYKQGYEKSGGTLSLNYAQLWPEFNHIPAYGSPPISEKAALDFLRLPECSNVVLSTDWSGNQVRHLLALDPHFVPESEQNETPLQQAA